MTPEPQKPTTKTTGRGFPSFVLYLFLLAAWLANTATGLSPRFENLQDSVDSQAAILEQRIFIFDGVPVDYPVWRNRLVIPLAIEALTKITPFSHSQSYLLTRLATAFLALAAFAWLLRSYLDANGWFVALATGIFSLSLGPTFLHIYDIPSDFLDAAAMALLTLFALTKRPVAFAIVLGVALLNREGAIFAVLLWAALYAYPLRNATTLKHLAYCAVVGGLGTALVTILRWWNAIPSIAKPAETLQPLMDWQVHAMQLWGGITHPHAGNSLYYLIGFILLFTLTLKAGWDDLKPSEKRLAQVAGMVAVASGLFSNLVELRTQMAAIVWFVFLVLVITHRRLDTILIKAGKPNA